MILFKNTTRNTGKYLPKSLGIELESYSPLMQELKDLLPSFTGSNSESSRIYECQIKPARTHNFVDVLMHGELVRRCLPNYTEGSGDSASGSAHCHLGGVPLPFTEDDMEILMIGLMPFLSMTYCRSKYRKYTFRAEVMGEGSRYSKFISNSILEHSLGNYGGRGGWIKDQGNRWGGNCYEVRANENTPLWVYFITTILTDSTVVNKLSEISKLQSTKNTAIGIVERELVGLTSWHDTATLTLEVVRAAVLKNMDNIVKEVDEIQRVLAKEVLTAYINEDEVKYDKIIAGVIGATDDVADYFSIVDKTTSKYSDEFNVVDD